MCEDRMTKYSFLTVGLSGSVPAHFDPDPILDAIKCPRAPSARLVPYCLRRAFEYLNFLSDIVSNGRLAPKEKPRWEMGPERCLGGQASLCY
jgi:hypothetical protein